MYALIMIIAAFLIICVLIGTVIGIFNTIKYKVIAYFVNKWEGDNKNE